MTRETNLMVAVRFGYEAVREVEITFGRYLPRWGHLTTEQRASWIATGRAALRNDPMASPDGSPELAFQEMFWKVVQAMGPLLGLVVIDGSTSTEGVGG